MEHKTITLSDQVFERLENDILSGNYAHGTVLTEGELVANMGVSRTPIREALQRLEQEKLVQINSKGIVVTGVTPDDLEDIFEIRYLLEGIAAKRTALRITPEELQVLQETIELQEFYEPKHDVEHIKEMDSRFHALIYEYSGSNVLNQTLEPLHRKVQKFRKASIKSHNRAKSSTIEHRKVFDAIANHDGDLAEKYMKEHIMKAKENIIKEVR